MSGEEKDSSSSSQSAVNNRLRRPMPLELHCEHFSALPLEHGSRLLSISEPIKKFIKDKVRVQQQKWQEFSDAHLPLHLRKYHREVPNQIRRIRELTSSYDPSAEGKRKLDSPIVERIEDDRVKCVQWVGERAVRDACMKKSRLEVMTHLVECVVNLYQFIRRNNDRIKDQLHYDTVENLVENLNPLLKAQPFPDNWDLGEGWAAERLQREYCAQLKAWSLKVQSLRRAHRKKLKQSNWYKELDDWHCYMTRQYKKIVGYWKAIRDEKPDEFDADRWRDRFLADIEQENQQHNDTQAQCCENSLAGPSNIGRGQCRAFK